MSKIKINKSVSKPLILIAPLDWGLGHATRCIPIINHFLQSDFQVIIAASNAGYELLKKEFPDTVILRCQGYDISYGKSNRNVIYNLFLQIPKIFSTYRKEKQWLKEIFAVYKPGLIISDNRFGFYHSEIPSVYISHQLNILTGNKRLNKIATRIHHLVIKKFSACWVPDIDQNGLAGYLSNNKDLKNIHYIGPLSRFETKNKVLLQYKILFLISGPEPQRTKFEKLIVAQIEDTKEKILLVRGLPGQQDILSVRGENVTVKNHLSSQDLNEAIVASELVISRSGYTTVMDLVKTKSQAIFVPTPGQKEQEYLASYLFKKKAFLFVRQEEFDLKIMLEKAQSFPFNIPEIDLEKYKTEIDASLNKLFPNIDL